MAFDLTMRREQTAERKVKTFARVGHTLNSLIAKTACGAAKFFYLTLFEKNEVTCCQDFAHGLKMDMISREGINIFVRYYLNIIKKRKFDVDDCIICNVLSFCCSTCFHFQSNSGTSNSGKLPISFARRQRNSGKPPSFSRTEFDKWFYPAVDGRTCARHVSRVPAFSDVSGAENTPFRQNFGSHVEGCCRPSAKRAFLRRNDAEIFMTENCPA